MLDQRIRRLLALYPRGASDSQLLWRLKDSSRAPEPEELLQALVVLSDRGEIRRDTAGRWQLAAMAAAVGRTVTPLSGQANLSVLTNELQALPMQIKDASNIPQIADDEVVGVRALPEPAKLFTYYAATQRSDPRGRIALFPDGHSQSWQLITANGAWWESCQLFTLADNIPASLRESLSRRGASGSAAIGWPLQVLSTPEGPSVLPALVLPVTWTLNKAGIQIEVSGGRPVLNPDWLMSLRRVSRWGPEAIVDRLFPEGEEDDLAAVSVRLRHSLATIGGAVLRPADLAKYLALPSEGLFNLLAFALPSDGTFTRGAAEDLEAIARWSPSQIAGSALSSLWTDQPPETATQAPAICAPQPLTDRQQAAADCALSHGLTVIQGPPGTGKSQVILSLILSSTLAGRSVLFASKNHQALDEVERRLNELFPSTRLLTRGRDAEGNRDVSFADALLEISRETPSRIDVEPVAISQLRSQLLSEAQSRATRRKVQSMQLELCSLHDELARLVVADENVANRQALMVPRFWQRVLSQLQVIFRLGRLAPQSINSPPTTSVIQRRISKLSALLKSSPESETYTQSNIDIIAVLKSLVDFQTKPSRASLELIIERVEEITFAGASKSRKLSQNDANLVLRHRPVWAISSLSVPSRVPLHAGLFDLVIFDEASQCDIASALPLMARARRAVVVGDPQQLRFIPGLSNGTEHALMSAAGLSQSGRSAIAQSTNSLFDFMARRPAVRKFFLKDQFRSAPGIVNYLNEAFYAHLGLEGRNEEAVFHAPLGYRAGIAWVDVKGRTTREDGGNVNEAETKSVIMHLRRLADDSDFLGSVGVLSPFNAQVAQIQRAAESALTAAERKRLGLRISTIDKFQGGEADVILFSLVAAPGSERSALTFLQKEARRLNVAISRARALCLVIGDLDFANSSSVPHIRKLAFRALNPTSPPREPFDSLWERRMDTALRARGIIPFPQYPVGTRYLDFALDPTGRKIDVEVDGRRWHTDADGNRKVEDHLRDIELAGRGWTVLRFWVHELSQDMERCLDDIERALGRR